MKKNIPKKTSVLQKPSKQLALIFYKPFRVMCQFSKIDNKQTLADFIKIPGIYPAGRLDYESEGLVFLTNDGKLQHQISHPSHKWPKTYYVQVEGTPNDEQIYALNNGIELKDGFTQPAVVQIINPPNLPPRHPPIRVRASIPDTWLEMTLTEGRNRQIRRMTAAVGLPTLRLVRFRIGEFTIEGLEPGMQREVVLK